MPWRPTQSVTPGSSTTPGGTAAWVHIGAAVTRSVIVPLLLLPWRSEYAPSLLQAASWPEVRETLGEQLVTTGGPDTTRTTAARALRLVALLTRLAVGPATLLITLILLDVGWGFLLGLSLLLVSWSASLAASLLIATSLQEAVEAFNDHFKRPSRPSSIDGCHVA